MIYPFNKALILCAVVISTVLIFSSAAYAQEPVVLAGKVVNGTADATVPADLEVSLHVVYSTGDVVDRTAQVDETGRFEFQDVSPEEDTVYVIYTEYQETVYSLELDSISPSRSLELSIYETVAIPESVTVDSNVMIITGADPEEGAMGVLESVTLINSGDRTFVPDISQPGEMMSLLRFSLPSSYTDLEVQSSLRRGEVVPVDTGFALTTPVPPGTHELLFTYRVPYEDDGASFVRSFPFGAGNFTVLVPEGLATVKAPALENLGVTFVGDNPYVRLEGQNFQRNASMNIDISGLPKQSTSPWWNVLGGGTITTVGIPLVLALMLAAIVAYLLVLRRSRRALAVESPAAGDDRPAMIASIARLDDLFERGKIEKEDYEKQRASLKGLLLQQADEEAGGEP